MRRTVELDERELGKEIQDRRTQMHALQHDQRALLKKAESERRDLSRSEVTKFDGLEETMDRLADELRELLERRERAIEDRPQRQIAHTDGGANFRDQSSSVILGREQRMADYFGARSDPDELEFGRRASLGRMVRGMAIGDWTDAEVERRALSTGTNAAGGFLTPEPLANFVIDRIRNEARVFEAGARTVPMASDQMSIPRLASGVTGAWRNENAAVAESDPVFERVTFTARTLAVMTRLSYELFQDLTPEGADVIESEIIKSLALELDRVALRGSGTAPEPRGVKNQTGVTTITNGANGTAGSWTMLVNAAAAVEAAGFNPNAAIASPRYAQSLALLTDSTGQPLQASPYIANMPILTSAQVPNTITTGTNTDTSELYVGDWPNLLVAFRPQVSISVQNRGGKDGMIGLKRDDSRYIDQMQIVLVAWLRADIQLLHPEAFAVSTGVRA